MVDLSVLRDLVAIASFIIALTYYILNIRHQKQARTIQHLHDITEFTSSNSNEFNLMMNMEWTDYQDFENKYGWENNPVNYNARFRTWQSMNYYGTLIEEGLIDVSTYIRVISDNAPIVWNKFKPIIEEMRINNDNPELYIGMEILSKETDEYRKRKGLKPKGT